MESDKIKCESLTADEEIVERVSPTRRSSTIAATKRQLRDRNPAEYKTGMQQIANISIQFHGRSNSIYEKDASSTATYLIRKIGEVFRETIEQVCSLPSIALVTGSSCPARGALWTGLCGLRTKWSSLPPDVVGIIPRARVIDHFAAVQGDFGERAGTRVASSSNDSLATVALSSDDVAPVAKGSHGVALAVEANVVDDRLEVIRLAHAFSSRLVAIAVIAFGSVTRTRPTDREAPPA